MSAETHSQNGHGSPTGWAGAWGPLADGRSRLGVARLRALASKTVASVGLEPKASPRAAAGVQARADTLLEHVRARWTAQRRTARPTRSGAPGSADDLARVARAELAAQARGAAR